jgi:hypothetical protein
VNDFSETPNAWRGPFDRAYLRISPSTRNTPLEGTPPPVQEEIPITELPLAGPIFGDEQIAIVQNGITSRTTISALGVGGGSGSATIIISPSAPSAPAVGALWWDSVGGQMYLWFDDGNSQQWVPVVNQSGGYLPLTGGVVTGPVDLQVQTVAASAGVLSINRNLGENVSVPQLFASITLVSIVGWPPPGFAGKVRLVIVNGGAFTISGWPSGVIWPSGIAPVLTSGAGKKDIILLMSDDGGVTIFGSIVGQDYR